MIDSFAPLLFTILLLLNWLLFAAELLLLAIGCEVNDCEVGGRVGGELKELKVLPELENQELEA
jgi:hypothetical protein